jgi:hypothetical protein
MKQPLGLRRVSIIVVASTFLFSLYRSFSGDAFSLRRYLDGSFHHLDWAFYIAGSTAVAGIAMIAGAFLVSWVLEGFKAHK